MKKEQRITKLSNDVVFNLLNEYKGNKITKIKMFIYFINKFDSKMKSIEKKADGSCFDVKDDCDTRIDNLDIEVSLETFKEETGIKNFTNEDITNFMNTVINTKINYEDEKYMKIVNLAETIEFNKENQSFKIVFTRSSLKYLYLIKSCFTLLDFNIIKGLNSKYEIGVYMLISRYNETGICVRTIKDLKSFFGMSGTTNDLTKYLYPAINKINESQEFEIKYQENKRGKRITSIKLTFKKQQLKGAE